jgi:rSAM/selenodomain-associated transferase 2/rSAM/selenodomain-associated transferase 1
VPARRLIVLAKPPLRGRAKSRLARGVGDGRAARLARAMLSDTLRFVAALTDAHDDLDARFAWTGSLESYPLAAHRPPPVPQGDGDLGARMARLAADALGEDGVQRVLLLGTDCPALPEAHVRAALTLLEAHEVVLGPVEDGGFWGLGLSATAPALRDLRWLDDIDWTAADTAAAVRARALALGLHVADAPASFDVDRAEDLPRLERALHDEPGRAPDTLSELGAPADTEPLSVVVAHLDEGAGLDACLDALLRQPDPLEIVVADGGSRDGSAERAAARPGVTVCVTETGRGRQLAAGAALATGDRLLFLHADVRLPPDGTRLIHAALDRPGAEAGAFVTRTLADPTLPDRAGPLLRLADVRSRITRHPYGDQALFVTRAAYEAVGGFRALPILEDYDLARRLAARRPIARITTPVTVSGRRMQTRPLRTTVALRLIPLLYRLGVDPVRLARLYRPWAAAPDADSARR